MSLSCLPRILKYEIKRCGFLLALTPRISVVPSANITSKEWQDPSIQKPAPWPYKEKKFTLLRAYWEGTLKRFDENTKIIVVDGNIGAGKSAFAKELAEAFGMLHVPEPTLERYYITPYGHDLRQLNPIAPPSYKICDLETYYKNPHHRNVAMMQYRMYVVRLETYVDALAHVLNTGQGIVMERSVYGDFVFMEAMYKAGYISDGALGLYKEINQNTLDELLKPHLIIYLDVSPEIALERIKKRNNPIEVNSPVLTKEYLESIEHFYKQKYLKDSEKHSELLIYDWSNFGDVEVVVEDIERINFERFDKYDTKLRDWRKHDDWEWGQYRLRYTNKRAQIVGHAWFYRPRVEEVYHPADEMLEYEELVKKLPGNTYADGFNTDAGDNVWFKVVNKSYWYQSYDRTSL